MKILAVDDNPDNVELLCQILEDQYDVITAYNGADCITLAKEQQPDLIILDVQMPEIDGYEVFQRLKEDESTREIPVIFLTARYKDTDRVVRGLELGAFDYITKPVEDEVLLAKVDIVTRLKKAEEQLKASLREKEVLLREIHHRVKNNMQAICSMLRLLYDKISDEQALAVLREGEDRIQAMAAVHELVYDSEDFANIDAQHYITQIVHNLFYSYGIRTDKISCTIDVENIFLELDTTIPCGLLINELVSNSLKYAFPGDRTGNITVSLHSVPSASLPSTLEGSGDEGFELIVSDTGIGLPEGFDFRDADTLGFNLVTRWADQLLGEITLDKAEETRFRIVFKKQG